ncbi:MAG: ABC transporter ATP-binding protein [Bacilli bacterium]|nr:ABC transporter ATP-binding protein [Bacilli bacterium]
MEIIKTVDLKKIFQNSILKQEVLRGINITISKGEFAGIIGPSGSGKTTLLYCLSSLEDISSGEVFVLGKDISKYTQKEIEEFRKVQIGFVFQFYNLIPNLTVYENILLARVIAEKDDSGIDEILMKVHMEDFKNYYPNQLSGGMQQRVAIARALVNQPTIIFADEPTGNLDQKNGKEIMDLLKELNEKDDITILLVTHNEDYLSYCNRIFKLIDGKII